MQLVSITADGQRIITNSRKVAEVFEKEHYNVLRDIEALDCGKEFTALNFEVSEYIDSTGRSLKEYSISKDGLVYLVMGYRGEKAAQMKVAYINAFNKMEEQLRKNHLKFATPELQSIFNSLLQINENHLAVVKVDRKVEALEDKSNAVIDALGSDNFSAVAKKASEPEWKFIIKKMTSQWVGRELGKISKVHNLERRSVPHPLYSNGIGSYHEQAWSILKKQLEE
jgi:Rha family phage regulatory protein